MSVDYDYSHSVEAVAELLTDPQFLVDRCIARGGLSAEGEAVEDDGRLVINTTREVEQPLPGFIKKITGAVQHAEVCEVWQQDGEGWFGTWDVKISGSPITIHADFELRPTANGSRYSATPKATAPIPLIGKKIEQFLQGHITKDLIADLDYTRDQLNN